MHCSITLPSPQDFSSLYQEPRTDAQASSFRETIKMMGDLYASAIGTTVLQLKDIPPRPSEYDGRIAVFGRIPNEETLRDALGKFGEIVELTIAPDDMQAAAQYSTHAAAEEASAPRPAPGSACPKVQPA